MKDSNVVCVADAAGCLGALAQGLRREFASTARSMFPVLLDKLKDKNSNVCAQCNLALATFNRHARLPRLVAHVADVCPVLHA